MANVEDRLTILETRIDTILPHLATKADLLRMLLAQVALAGIIIGVLKLL